MKKTPRTLFWLAAGCGLLLFLWLAMRDPSSGGPREGAPAPALELADISGQVATLAQYRGQVVLLDFWATWCDACVEELPELKKLHAKYAARGVVFVAPSVDQEGRRVLIPFIAANAVPWRVLVADDAAIRTYRIFGLPAKFLIDRRGIVARKFVGPVDPLELDREIAAVAAKTL